MCWWVSDQGKYWFDAGAAHVKYIIETFGIPKNIKWPLPSSLENPNLFEALKYDDEWNINKS